MLLIREAFKNAVTVIAYICTEGKSATAATVGELTATAKYKGSRGNALTFAVIANPIGGFDVEIYLDGSKVKFFEGVTKVSELSDSEYIVFTGETLSAVAGTTLSGGADPDEAANADIAAFLDAVEGVRWNTMAFPLSSPELQTALKTRIKYLRETIGRGVQAVAPDFAADYEGIINLTNSYSTGDKRLTTAQATAYVAGATASAAAMGAAEERLSEINVELEDMVGIMNMEDGAAAAAGATIEAYIETIKAGASGAEDAAALVNAAVSRGLNAEAWDYNEMSARANPTKALVPGHANGTTNAEDVFIAGENGPELIVGAHGSTVFPTEETDRIIAAIGSRPLNIMPSGSEYSAAAENAPSPESYKRISLEITGAGAITVDRGADRERILSVMQENIKPVLLDIIQKEIFEEGEGSYDDGKLIISEAITVVPRHLTEYKTTLDIKFSGDTSLDGTTDVNSMHSHKLKDLNIFNAELTIHNELKKGERVHILALNNGKKYYILDRVK